MKCEVWCNGHVVRFASAVMLVLVGSVIIGCPSGLSSMGDLTEPSSSSQRPPENSAENDESSDGADPSDGEPQAEEPLYPESAHPYANSYDNEWSFTQPGDPSSIDVTFDSRTATESCCDRIYVMDATGSNISGSPFRGAELSGSTVTVPGATVRIRLTSDGSVTNWGFAITQVTVGDPCASFRLLRAEVLRPSVIKFYFQVESCSGNPIGNVAPNDFQIEEDDEPVSMFESNQGFVPEPQPFGLDTALLLDMSGSIVNSGNIPALQNAAHAFLDAISDDHLVAIYLFDGREDLVLLSEFTDSVSDLHDAVDSLSAYELVDESTNLNGAVIAGIGVLNERRDAREEGNLYAASLVVFTDGTDRAGRRTNAEARIAAQETSHQVYSIGLGGEIDQDHLESIGNDGAYFANDVDALEASFEHAAERIEARARSHYVLAYCSPKRNGTHEVRLSLTGWSGSVAYTFSADDFDGGCSSSDFLSD
jgi:hypothetical protein